MSPRRLSFDVEREGAEPRSLMDQEPALADTFMVTINEYELQHTQHETDVGMKEKEPETLCPNLSQDGGETLASSTDIHGEEGDGECQEPAVLTDIVPVAESASMQHEIDIELLDSAMARKGVLRDGGEDSQEVELVDGSVP